MSAAKHTLADGGLVPASTKLDKADAVDSVESWKLRFYGERLSTGQIWGTLGRSQALAPFHLLFERAWARVEAGDKPRYEDVKGK